MTSLVVLDRTQCCIPRGRVATGRSRLIGRALLYVVSPSQSTHLLLLVFSSDCCSPRRSFFDRLFIAVCCHVVGSDWLKASQILVWLAKMKKTTFRTVEEPRKPEADTSWTGDLTSDPRSLRHIAILHHELSWMTGWLIGCCHDVAVQRHTPRQLSGKSGKRNRSLSGARSFLG